MDYLNFSLQSVPPYKKKISYYTRCCVLHGLENSFSEVLYDFLTQSLKFLQVTNPYYVYKIKNNIPQNYNENLLIPYCIIISFL